MDSHRIRDLPKASTLDARLSVLASVPDVSRAGIASHAARMLDSHWIEAIVAGGLLDVSKEIQELPEDAGIDAPIVQEWLAIVRAMLEFGRRAALTETPFVDARGFSRSSDTLTLDTPEEFAALYGAATAAVLSTWSALQQHPVLAVPGQNPVLLKAMSQWSHALAMLDQASALCDVLQSCPEAIRKPILLPDLGLDEVKGLELTIVKPRMTVAEIGWTPYFTAIQFSRARCLEALARAGLGATTPIGQVVADGFAETKHLGDWLEFAMPVCTQATMEATLHALMSDPRKDHANAYLLGDTARKSMGGNAALSCYQTVFAAAGLYKNQSLHALQEACRHGLAATVYAMAPHVDWQEVRESLPNKTSPLYVASRGSNRDDRERAMLAFMDIASRNDVDPVLLFGNATTGNPHSKEPAFGMLLSGYHDLVLRYLENGWDPRAKVSDEDVSALALAEQKTEEGASLLRSFLARQATRDLLAPGPRPTN